MATEFIHEEEEEPEQYLVPDNYTDSGKILDGMLSLRNALEAGLIAAIMYFIENTFVVPFVGSSTGMVVMLLTILPVAAVALFGLNGDSFSVFIKSLVRFAKNKRKMRFRRIRKHEQKKTK